MKKFGVFWVLITLLVLLACMDKNDSRIDHTQTKTGVVTANGIEFSYFIEGTGIPCIVVGDGLTPSRALSRKLRNHIRFVFLNSRMTIRPEKAGEVANITMDTLVDDIEEVRRALDLGSVCVLGHSIAGILALEYARKYPQRTTHVIMHGTPPYFNQHYKEAVSTFWEERASEERKKTLEANWADIGVDSLNNLSSSDAAILRYVTNASKYFHDPAYDPAWLFEDVYWNVDAWNHLFDVIMANYDIGTGPALQTPVFLAIGRDDYAVPFILWDTERAKIANVSYNLFEQSGHYPMLEEQELFDKKLLAWIQEKGKTD
jgi:proline iminopeptidase